MSAHSVDASLYDPDRPWIAEEREDPDKANYIEVFTNPMGESPKPVFLRAQALLWIARYLTLAVTFTVATGKLITFIPLAPNFKLFEGMPTIGLASLFGMFLLFSVLSCISHVRRLNDAGRSPGWTLIVPIPLVIASLVGIAVIFMGGMMSKMSPEDMKAKFEKARQVDAPKDEVLADSNGAAASDDKSADKDAKSASATDDKSKKKKRRGPPGQKMEPPKASDFVFMAMRLGLLTWLITGLFTMLFSNFFVARAQRRS